MKLENVALLFEAVKFVSVTFKGSNSSKRYTYKVPASWTVSVGDELIVDSPFNGAAIVTIEAILPFEDIDLDAAFRYKWAVAIVDYNEYRVREQAFFNAQQQLKKIAAETKRQKQLKALADEYGEGFLEAVKAMLAHK